MVHIKIHIYDWSLGILYVFQIPGWTYDRALDSNGFW